MMAALEKKLGSTFSRKPTLPSPSPLLIVISGPSGVGKDAVINRLHEVKQDMHFVVTATTRPRREVSLAHVPSSFARSTHTHKKGR